MSAGNHSRERFVGYKRHTVTISWITKQNSVNRLRVTTMSTSSCLWKSLMGSRWPTSKGCPFSSIKERRPYCVNTQEPTFFCGGFEPVFSNALRSARLTTFALLNHLYGACPETTDIATCRPGRRVGTGRSPRPHRRETACGHAACLCRGSASRPPARKCARVDRHTTAVRCISPLLFEHPVACLGGAVPRRAAPNVDLRRRAFIEQVWLNWRTRFDANCAIEEGVDPACTIRIRPRQGSLCP